MKTYQALVLNKDGNNIISKLTNLSLPKLKSNEVRVKVSYSDLNYKDMLANKAGSGVVKSYPIVPGVDLSGIVIESKNKSFQSGDKVLATGYGLGVDYDGGLSEITDVPADWLIKLPEKLSLKTAMIYGTAGLTAGLAINKLIQAGMNPHSSVLITGGTGGVASVAITILNKLGYQKINVATRSLKNTEYLRHLGATNIIPTNELETNKMLAKQKFDFVLDTIGGKMIHNLLPYIKYNGAISICGNVIGNEFNTSVFPFILRNITLLGIDSVQIPIQDKQAIWEKLATVWNIADKLNYNEISLGLVKNEMNSIENGTHQGRTIVKI